MTYAFDSVRVVRRLNTQRDPDFRTVHAVTSQGVWQTFFCKRKYRSGLQPNSSCFDVQGVTGVADQSKLICVGPEYNVRRTERCSFDEKQLPGENFVATVPDI